MRKRGRSLTGVAPASLVRAKKLIREQTAKIMGAVPAVVDTAVTASRRRQLGDGQFYTAMNIRYGICPKVTERILEAFLAPGPTGEVLARERLLAPSDLPPWARDRLADAWLG